MCSALHHALVFAAKASIRQPSGNHPAIHQERTSIMFKTSQALKKSLVTTVVLLAASTTAWAAEKSAAASPTGGKVNPAVAEARADIKATLGFVPQFFLDFPEVALPGSWQEMKGLQMNPKTALPGKVKELIGLGVAAQVPCHYCIVAHTEFGKLNGATKAEIGEAVAMAAITRHWSTYLNGIQTDETAFRAEIKQLTDNAKKAMANPKAAPPPAEALVDGQSAVRDITATLGFAPEFLKRFPEAGRAGAWRTMKEVQMSPNTAISPKNKELIGLAVASQVPCKFCVIAHTEFAKLSGASDAEINEAIGMAALTRHMSTVLNGMQTDQAVFSRDLSRLVSNAKAAAKASAEPTRGKTGIQPASTTTSR
jgi:AhpD family alkylhydroperoxidase